MRARVAAEAAGTRWGVAEWDGGNARLDLQALHLLRVRVLGLERLDARQHHRVDLRLWGGTGGRRGRGA